MTNLQHIQQESWVDKYAGMAIYAVLLAVLIWIGSSVAATNSAIIELKTKFEGQMQLNQQKYGEFDRRILLLEDWRNRQMDRQQETLTNLIQRK